MSIKKMLIVSSMITFGLLFQSRLIAVTLDDVEFSSLPGDRVQINLIFSEALADDPVNFTIDNPARIAIDLPEVQLNLEESNQTIGIGDVLGIVAVEAAGRSRVVVNLVRSVAYDMRLDGQSVLLCPDSKNHFLRHSL